MIDEHAPYWTVGDVDAGPRVPWSGEVIPLDVPPIPVEIPIAGPPIHWLGDAEHATWDAVWGFVKGAAKIKLSDLVDVGEAAVREAVRVAETYTGEALSTMAGFINDSFDYAASALTHVADAAWDIEIRLWKDVQYLDASVYAILADVVGIEGHVIPDVIRRLLTLETNTWDLVGAAVEGVEAWAIDNIRDPLTAELEREIASVRTDVWNLTGAWVDELLDQITAERLARLAAAGAIAAAAAEALTWIEECGEPMCQNLGPKTDLGKFLKGLKVAQWLVLLAYLSSLDEAKIEALIRTVAAGAEGIFDELGDVFGGTGTLGGILG